MELELLRTYAPEGTNGNIMHGRHLVCHSIELPWRANQHGVSCIPEGYYQLNRCYSKKFGWHLILKNVPDRNLILIHPANDAQKELRGCIAPVDELLRPGVGLGSRKAMEVLTRHIFPVLKKGEDVFLHIKLNLSTSYECSTKSKSTYTEVF